MIDVDQQMVSVGQAKSRNVDHKGVGA